MEDCFEMMGINNYKIITKEYYSSWLGVDIDTIATGIEFVYSKERNLVQPGHGCRYDLWMWLDDNKWIIRCIKNSSKSAIQSVRTSVG